MQDWFKNDLILGHGTRHNYSTYIQGGGYYINGLLVVSYLLNLSNMVVHESCVILLDPMIIILDGFFLKIKFLIPKTPFHVYPIFVLSSIVVSCPILLVYMSHVK